MQELALEDPKGYQKVMPITTENFNFVLEKFSDRIQKTDKIMRESIPANMKLQVTLDYLATGNNLRSLQKSYRISMLSILSFLPEVLDAIYNGLLDYIKIPVLEEDWQKN